MQGATYQCLLLYTPHPFRGARVVVTKVNYISCTNLYSCVLYTIPAAPTCQYSFIRYAVHTIRFSRTYLTNGLPYNHHHAAPVPVRASSFFILVSPSIISFPASPSRVYWSFDSSWTYLYLLVFYFLSFLLPAPSRAPSCYCFPLRFPYFLPFFLWRKNHSPFSLILV